MVVHILGPHVQEAKGECEEEGAAEHVHNVDVRLGEGGAVNDLNLEKTNIE